MTALSPCTTRSQRTPSLMRAERKFYLLTPLAALRNAMVVPGRHDAALRDESPDVRIHDFPITRWIGRSLRDLVRRRRAAERQRQLADLPEHTLQDLGLSDRDVKRVAHRNFWFL